MAAGEGLIPLAPAALNGHAAEAPGRVFVEGGQCVTERMVTTTRMVRETQMRRVPYTVTRMVRETTVKKVPYTVTKMVPHTVCKTVPVTTGKPG